MMGFQVRNLPNFQGCRTFSGGKLLVSTNGYSKPANLNQPIILKPFGRQTHFVSNKIRLLGSRPYKIPRKKRTPGGWFLMVFGWVFWPLVNKQTYYITYMIYIYNIYHIYIHISYIYICGWIYPFLFNTKYCTINRFMKNQPTGALFS